MIQDNIKELISFRRTLHANPEIGYQEYNTSKLIREKLDQIGISYKSGLAKTGIVAELEKGEGKCIALRADMDALPILEETDLDFASKNEGVMHACGHDVHTTILLGAIMELMDKKFKGKIKFIFQPSEEGINGDIERKSGGQRLVELGVLQDVDCALALHVHSLLEVGKLNFALGSALACANSFTIEVIGKAGHAGAAPHLATDAVLVATALIQNLYSIVSRDINPTSTGVLSISMVNGGVAPNIVADKVTIRGTVRALETEEYEQIIHRMKQIIEGVATAFEATINFDVDFYYPSLKNDGNVHKRIENVAEKLFPLGVSEADPVLGGEDFAFYSREVPSMFYFLGAKNTTEPCYFLHHPKVIINEDCIPYGIDFLTNSALELLTDA